MDSDAIGLLDELLIESADGTTTVQIEADSREEALESCHLALVTPDPDEQMIATTPAPTCCCIKGAGDNSSYQLYKALLLVEIPGQPSSLCPLRRVRRCLGLRKRVSH